MSGVVHMIRRQVIDVRHRGGGDGLAVQRDAERMWHEHLQQRIAALLDQYHIPGIVTSLDKLEIDVTDMTTDDLKNGNTQKIIRQIEEALQRSLGADTAQYAAMQEASFFRKWLFYLERGHLPWWSNITDTAAWKKQLEDFLADRFTDNQLQALKASMQQEPVRLRLLTQLDEKPFANFIAQFYHPDYGKILELYDDIIMLSNAFGNVQQIKTLAGKALLDGVWRDISTDEMIRQLAKEISVAIRKLPAETYDVSVFEQLKVQALKDLMIYSTDSKDLLVKEDKTVLHTDAIDTGLYEDGIYISNAGAVIFAVYLPAFFSRLGLQEEGQLKDGHKCVALINYLATGNRSTEEFESVIAKILCGLMPDDFADTACVISDEECEMADHLLQAVITNWDKLKNTSPDGLRNSFLKREGKLTLKQGNWILEVQHEAFDILLQFLPWSISIIKLPWMDRLLHVKWE